MTCSSKRISAYNKTGSLFKKGRISSLNNTLDQCQQEIWVKAKQDILLGYLNSIVPRKAGETVTKDNKLWRLIMHIADLPSPEVQEEHFLMIRVMIRKLVAQAYLENLWKDNALRFAQKSSFKCLPQRAVKRLPEKKVVNQQKNSLVSEAIFFILIVLCSWVLVIHHCFGNR